MVPTVESGISIVEGWEAQDFGVVHGWLTQTYWSPGIAREKVERAAKGSALVLGAFDGAIQVGYLRIVSDRATFAWVSDVFVAEQARGKGLATRLMEYALNHPELQGLRRWVLATKDAHHVYEQCGFSPLNEPSRWMIRLNPNWPSS